MLKKSNRLYFYKCSFLNRYFKGSNAKESTKKFDLVRSQLKANREDSLSNAESKSNLSLKVEIYFVVCGFVDVDFLQESEFSDCPLQ